MIEITLTAKQRRDQSYALKHHANRLDIMHARLIQRCVLSSNTGELTAWSSGPNSVVLYLDDGRTVEGWYFSGRPDDGEIRVRLGCIPMKDYATYVLRTRKDVDKMCDELGI